MFDRTEFPDFEAKVFDRSEFNRVVFSAGFPKQGYSL